MDKTNAGRDFAPYLRYFLHQSNLYDNNATDISNLYISSENKDLHFKDK
jgi:hypothetical protein